MYSILLTNACGAVNYVPWAEFTQRVGRIDNLLADISADFIGRIYVALPMQAKFRICGALENRTDVIASDSFILDFFDLKSFQTEDRHRRTGPGPRMAARPTRGKCSRVWSRRKAHTYRPRTVCRLRRFCAVA